VPLGYEVSHEVLLGLGSYLGGEHMGIASHVGSCGDNVLPSSFRQPHTAGREAIEGAMQRSQPALLTVEERCNGDLRGH
jgi:hypothetical protein